MQKVSQREFDKMKNIPITRRKHDEASRYPLNFNICRRA